MAQTMHATAKALTVQATPKAQAMHARHIKSDSKPQVQYNGKHDNQFAGQA